VNRAEKRRAERRRPAVSGASPSRASQLAEIDAEIATMEAKLAEAEAMIAALREAVTGMKAMRDTLAAVQGLRGAV
jgi:hypothetical protein